VAVSSSGIPNSKITSTLPSGVTSDSSKTPIDKIIVDKAWLIVWGKAIPDSKIVVC